MSFSHSFDPKSTSVSFSWPSKITGLERIFLSTKGDLQNVLSAFFAQPIIVSVVYANTMSSRTGALEFVSPATVDAVSQENALYQTRQVHLSCKGDIICTATSKVRMLSPEVAHLFLLDKYPIGQTFKKLGQAPQFQLLEVGFGNPNQPSLIRSDAYIWRKYNLTVQQFECTIVEVFPREKLCSTDPPFVSAPTDINLRLFGAFEWKASPEFARIRLFLFFLTLMFMGFFALSSFSV